MIFLDTSVLVAVALINHRHHAASRSLWNTCSGERTTVSSHTLAELYSTLTALPPGLRISPGLARQALDTFLERVTPVALTAAESVETLRGCAARNLAGGIIYDALHLACARKAAADQIYTWNLRHFRLAAPDLADRIQTP